MCEPPGIGPELMGMLRDWFDDVPQHPLTDTPRARRADPDTSHEAAERIKASGALAAHQVLIRDAIRQNPGMTYTQIAEVTGLERHAVGRRLKELEPIWIRRGEPVRIGASRMATWFPVHRST